MNGTWPDDFDLILEEAKAFMAEPESSLSNFGPLALYVENHMLAHIVATTLLHRKVLMGNISNRDVFILYGLLNNYRINWAQ